MDHAHQRGRASERHELQHVHEWPQARRHRSESKDPRGSRGARSRRVYGARRQGALRIERSVSSRYTYTAAARLRSTAAVFFSGICHPVSGTCLMNLQEYLAQAENVERDGIAALENAHDAAELEAARIAYLGDRQGRVKALQEALRSITKDEKPAAGKCFNEVRTRLEA